jgi:hypothetical protein
MGASFGYASADSLYMLTLGTSGLSNGRPHARTLARISPTAFSSDNFFYLCSLHIGIRQGAALLELGDLEAVASKRGSPQLGGYPAIFPAFRFLYRVSIGDYSDIIGPGWHLSSPGQT